MTPATLPSTLANADNPSDVIASMAATNFGITATTAHKKLTSRDRDVLTDARVRRLSPSSVFELCAIVASAHGVQLEGSRVNRDVLNTMQKIENRVSMDISADSGGGAGGMATMSLSGLTENILNKGLLDGYQQVSSIVPQIAWETETNDFKPFKRYRITASGIMSALGASGELKSISLQDESYSNSVKTQGVIINIGREMLFNDDLGAIAQLPVLLGRGAALYREMIVIGIYLGLLQTPSPGASIGRNPNPNNFFSIGNANLLTGAGSALGIPGLTTAAQRLMEQVDANSMPIMVNADRLLVPPALKVAAQNLFNGSALVVTALAGGGTAGTLPDQNPHAGLYRPLVSPFLAAAVAARIAKLPGDPVLANYALASDTAWALLANPANGMSIIQVGYLAGTNKEPVIEKGNSNFNQLGMAMRCYYDFGAAPHDARVGVFSTGQ